MLAGQPASRLISAEQRELRADEVPDIPVFVVPRQASNLRDAANAWATVNRNIRHMNHVVLDMKNVDRVNRVSTAAIVRCLHRCHRRGSQVALCNLEGQVRSALELSGVQHLAPMYESADDALLSFHDVEAAQ